ncbi:MAG: aminotransferase class I/II-fold pyridoxal phosphate-dependent enzyme [Galactobacter sp.]
MTQPRAHAVGHPAARTSAAQAATPYADALQRHADRDPLMFMVPGHAATPDGLSKDLADFVGERAVRMDIPVLVDGIDVGPESPYVEAERLAAEAWGAQRTWFLANGSSQGNRMAVIAAHALGLSDTILAQRSAHSSFTDGLVVSGATPEWILPQVDVRRGINHGLTPGQLDAALTRTRGPVYVVSPSYFGAVADIPGLAEVAHAHGVPLIVDAAWGAHFGFHPSLPDFPTTQGADIVVTSTHKMGGALGQAALLHLASGPFTEALEPVLERAYQLTQTTSASSLLLASIDVARRSLVLGGDALEDSVEQAQALRQRVRSIPGLEVASDSFAEYPDIVDTDPLRVSIDVLATGLTGYQVREALANEHAVYVEIATIGAVAAFLGPGKVLDLDRFESALRAVIEAGAGSPTADDAAQVLSLPSPGPLRTTPREAYFARAVTVPAEEAIGRVSAGALAAYPPGVPNVVPGEEITRESLDYLRAVAASPIGYVRGAADPALDTVRVLA